MCIIYTRPIPVLETLLFNYVKRTLAKGPVLTRLFTNTQI